MSRPARTVILHADDLGMCHASVAAMERLVKAPVPWSGAVMTPCPWFEAAAAVARRHRSVDLGLHLTLTSEWTTYKWGPLTARHHVANAAGYFPRGFDWERLRTGLLGATAEFAAQYARAVRAGIDVTHVDTHMGTAFAPKILPAYVRLARRHRLPAFLPRLSEAQLRRLGAGRRMAKVVRRLLLPWLAGRFPLFDGYTMLPLDGRTRGVAAALRHLDRLPPGLSYVMMHPSADTPELRAIDPSWRSRVSDLATLLDPAFGRGLARLGIRLTTCRALRAALRRGR